MDLVNVDGLVERYPWLNPNGLRALLFRRKENGLNKAVVRVGRRLLVDTDAFDAWLSEQREAR